MKKFIPPLVNKPFKPPAPLNAKTDDKKTDAKSTPAKTPIKKESTTTGGATSAVKPTSRAFKPPTQVSKAATTTKTKVGKNEKVEVSSSNDGDEFLSIWNVMYCKKSNKKHKTYDDGILLVKAHKYILHDTNGKVVTQKVVGKTIDNLREGDVVEIGAKDVEFVSQIKEEDYTSGKVFLQYQSLATVGKPVLTSTKKALTTQFKAHDSSKIKSDVKKEVVKIKAPEGSIMLNEGHPEKDGGKEVHDVFVEPFLARSLREHQVEGVRFMYECIMGYRSFQGKGCLLADEMGLGKTLQSIALMWTLFSRGPQGAPVLKKAIIVTNSSLVNNWKNEIKKWLGNERIKPLVCQAKTGKKTPADTIKEFKTGYNKVMIISYDLCVRNADELKACRCDLLICDEGHKLKNSNIKIFQALKNVQTARRIALSGTPMQNDLGEFFSIVDFINPGLLGTDKSFKSLFTDPIDKSREPDAKAEHKRIGLARSQELNKLVSEFVLRRTSEILTKHLPPKYEMLVFCKMNPLQEQLYKYFVKSKYVYQLFANSEQKSAMGRHALSCIQNLKKLLTHPDMIYNVLVRDEEDDDEDDAEYDKRERFKETWQDSLSVFPKNYGSNTLDPTQSGKMELLDDLLRETHSKGDRIVVVSNFTSILNQIERLCGLRQYTFVRLDGSTPSDKRMQIVDEYNNGKSKDFVFLLSSRAGGAGLNLIGANRLVLFDPDWNPSNDHQAMARVWRDGQKKNVFIYRFISTGTIEEKIYQRQMVKTGLSKSVVDEKSMNKAAFSKEELRSLFGYNEDTICDTFSDEAEGADLEAIVKPVDAVLLKAIKGKKSVTFVKISKSEEEDALIAKNAITAPDEVEAAEESTENETSDEDTVMDVIDKEADEEEFNFDNKSDDESSEASDEEADEDEPPKKKQKIEYSSEESDD